MYIEYRSIRAEKQVGQFPLAMLHTREYRKNITSNKLYRGRCENNRSCFSPRPIGPGVLRINDCSAAPIVLRIDTLEYERVFTYFCMNLKVFRGHPFMFKDQNVAVVGL